MNTTSNEQRVEFEVFGTVQKVFFRKYTQAEATRLGLTGWVENTVNGTVVGVAQGPLPKLKEFEKWLGKGSPKSTVTKVIARYCSISMEESYSDFTIKRRIR